MFDPPLTTSYLGVGNKPHKTCKKVLQGTSILKYKYQSAFKRAQSFKREKGNFGTPPAVQLFRREPKRTTVP